MRIQQVEALVGITKKNLRFYEQAGLLQPGRTGSGGYRDYSDADVLLLRQIKLLRQLGIPLEEIRKLQQGALTVGDAMTRRKTQLQREQANLEENLALCSRMEDLSIPLSRLEPEPYLSEIEALKQKGARFMDQKNDVRRHAVPAVIAAAVMILLMGAVLGILIWAQIADPIPLPVLLVVLLIPAAVCVGVVAALISRIRELQTGEEFEARKY